jgi:hypothetical protein
LSDCCSDYQSKCVNTTTGSCSESGACGSSTPVTGGCYCDYNCQIYNDCCDDFWWLC